MFPAGTYLVSSVSLNVAGQRWSLDAGATLRLRDGANASVLRLSAADASVGGGHIDGNAAAQSSSGTCVVVTGARAAVVGVDIGGCLGWGVYIRGASGVRIAGNVVHDTADAAIFAENDGANGANNCVFDGNTVRRTQRAGAGGIIVHGDGANASSGSRITNNRVENVAQISIEVWGKAPSAVISNNVTIGGDMGVSVDTSDDTQVLANTVSAARTYGIELAGSQRVTVRGNTVNETGVTNGTGIALTGINATSHANVLDQNHIVGANRGIQLNVGADDNTVTANLIESWSTFGVEIIGSQRIRVSGNTIATGGSQGVALDNSSSVDVLNNTFRTARTAVGLYGHDGTTVDFVTVTGNTFQSITTGLSEAGSVGTHIVYDGP